MNRRDILRGAACALGLTLARFFPCGREDDEIFPESEWADVVILHWNSMSVPAIDVRWFRGGMAIRECCGSKAPCECNRCPRYDLIIDVEDARDIIPL